MVPGPIHPANRAITNLSDRDAHLLNYFIVFRTSMNRMFLIHTHNYLCEIVLKKKEDKMVKIIEIRSINRLISNKFKRN